MEKIDLHLSDQSLQVLVPFNCSIDCKTGPAISYNTPCQPSEETKALETSGSGYDLSRDPVKVDMCHQ